MKKLLMLIAACAVCANEQEIKADNTYVGVTGGLNWSESATNKGVTVDFKQGYNGTATLGYEWLDGFRVEGEFGYRHNKIRKAKTKMADGAEINLHGNLHGWSTMANALYDLPVNMFFTPYVGAGIGYSVTKLHAEHALIVDSVSKKRDGFAHQFIVGAKYPIATELALDVKYRYQKTHSVPYSQSVELGLVYAF